MSNFVYSNNKGGIGNDTHYGKGSPKGGQFAPKDGNGELGENYQKLTDFAERFIQKKGVKVKFDSHPRYDANTKTLYIAEDDKTVFVHEFLHCLDNEFYDGQVRLIGSLFAGDDATFNDSFDLDLKRLNIDQISSDILNAFKEDMFRVISKRNPQEPTEKIIQAIDDTLKIETEHNLEKEQQHKLLQSLGASKEQIDLEDSKMYANKHRKRNAKIKEKELRKSISDALDICKYKYGYGVLSDLFSAIDSRLGTQNSLTKALGVSHKNDYWSVGGDKSGRTSRAASEVFAHLGSLKYTKPNLYRKMKKILPLSTIAFDNIMDKIIK